MDEAVEMFSEGFTVTGLDGLPYVIRRNGTEKYDVYRKVGEELGWCGQGRRGGGPTGSADAGVHEAAVKLLGW